MLGAETFFENLLLYIIFFVFIPLFFIGFVLEYFMLNFIFRFRLKVKRIQPKLFSKVMGFKYEPDEIYTRENMKWVFLSGPPRFMSYYLTLGFFSKQKTEKFLDFLFKIHEIRKLKNSELNRSIERLVVLFRVSSAIFFLLFSIFILLVLIVLYGSLFL